MSAQRAKVEVQTLKIEDVLQRLKEGSIRVPDFQRPLKWKREDNRLFFESLLRGYPVGSLLVWVRAEEAGRIRLGPFETDARGTQRAWRVVDGQQRLTALAGALLPMLSRPSDFNFVVDIQTGEVEVARQGYVPSKVPLEVLGSIDELVPWLHEHPSVDLRAAAEYSKRLREYPLSIVVLDVDDQGFVEDVFKRLNRSGKRLTQAEVFRASHGRRKAGRALVQAMTVGEELRFGELDESNLLRALKAIAGQDPLSELDGEEPGNAEELVRGTREAVVLLKQTGVSRAELLPYSLPFGVLVAFFARHRDVTTRTRLLLEFWFWRATFSFELKGDFTSIRSLYARAVVSDEHEAAQELLGAFPESPRGVTPRASFTLNSAAGKMAVLLLLAQGPRNLETGEQLPVTNLLEQSTPRQLMQAATKSGNSQGVLNSIFHPALPRAQLRRLLEDASPEVARSHLLPMPFEDSTDWAKARATMVLRSLDEFALAKSGVHQSIRPALAALGDPQE